MMTLEEMKKLLEASLPHKRFQHSLYVYETALKMGERFHGNMEKISIAALLHDCGREIPTKDSLQYAREHHIPLDFVEEHQPVLLHAKLVLFLPKINMALRMRKSCMPLQNILRVPPI
jgi:HD superfamily phosphohydrolase YqeK